MMKKEKKLCGRVENNLKSVHLVLLKCAPSFPTPKKKGLISTPQITKTEQKKPNKKKNCSNIQHHHKKEDDAFTRDRETFFSVLVSLSAYTHHETHRRRLASR
jgi:hypothetical protein